MRSHRHFRENLDFLRGGGGGGGLCQLILIFAKLAIFGQKTVGYLLLVLSVNCIFLYAVSL